MGHVKILFPVFKAVSSSLYLVNLVLISFFIFKFFLDLFKFFKFNCFKMIIFKDKITGDEFFTDSSKFKIIDDCIYEVSCKLETRKEGEVVLPGANPSAEDGGEEFDESVQTGLDVVLNHGLVETSFPNKNGLKAYLKDYTKRLNKHLEENGATPEDIAKFKTRMSNAVKFLLPKYDDLQCFIGASTDPDALVAFVLYNDDQSVSMYLFLAGIDEEKV